MDKESWEEMKHKPCKIIERHQDVGIYKLECETHNQTLLNVYTYRGKVCICCKLGEENHSGGDYETSLCVDCSSEDK